MGNYRVEITRHAGNELEDIQPRFGRRISEAIERLALQPRPSQSRKLVGSEDTYRLRIGVYRVLYHVDDENRVITVTAVGHRRNIYR